MGSNFKMLTVHVFGWVCFLRVGGTSYIYLCICVIYCPHLYIPEHDVWICQKSSACGVNEPLYVLISEGGGRGGGGESPPRPERL